MTPSLTPQPCLDRPRGSVLHCDITHAPRPQSISASACKKCLTRSSSTIVLIALLQFWIQGLTPNTRYGFRVRAFNGFGPGVYAHGCFATRPAQPATPVLVRAAPTEVVLQWVFGSRTTAKVSIWFSLRSCLQQESGGARQRPSKFFLFAIQKCSPHSIGYSRVDAPRKLKREPASFFPRGVSEKQQIFLSNASFWIRHVRRTISPTRHTHSMQKNNGRHDDNPPSLPERLLTSKRMLKHTKHTSYAN